MDLNKLEAFCKKLKGTTKDIKWGNDLCFSIGGKLYCVAGLEPGSGISFKVLPEEFAELTSRDGIIPAHYVARYHWITINNFNSITKDEWAYYIKQSYQLIFNKLNKKLQQEILIGIKK